MGRKSRFGLIVLLFLTSCGFGVRTPTASPATEIPEGQATPQDTEEFTPSPSIILEPLTHLPTFSPMDAEETIVSSLKDDANCQFPCWLGITPGDTNWAQANQIMQQFLSIATRFEYEENDGAVMVIQIPSKATSLYISYTRRANIVSILYAHTGIYPEEYPIVINENHPYFQLLRKYSLQSILTNLGPPDQILVRSYNINAFGILTRTQLYYPDLGVLFGYFSPTDYIFVAENQWLAVTCPVESFVEMRFFDPGDGQNLAATLNYYDNFSRYKDIESVTNMTTTEFVENYSSGRCDIKLETPGELWPSEER